METLISFENVNAVKSSTIKPHSVLTDRLLTVGQVAEILGYSKKYAYRFLREHGPAPVKAAANAEARYWASDIDGILNAPK